MSLPCEHIEQELLAGSQCPSDSGTRRLAVASGEAVRRRSQARSDLGLGPERSVVS